MNRLAMLLCVVTLPVWSVEPTTRWLGEVKPPPAHQCLAGTFCVDDTGYLMFGTIGKLVLPDGTAIEYGLRSDGVMVWRKVTKGAAK